MNTRTTPSIPVNPIKHAAMAVAVALVLAGQHAVAMGAPVPSALFQDTHSGSHGSGHQAGGAEQDNHGSGQDKGKARRGASGRGETDSGSRSVESKVLREDVGAPEEDSDRRGPKYGGGRSATGKPPGAGSKKGDLYGDLYVILRDANGVPILDENGFVQPVDANGNPIPLNDEGEIEPGYEDLALTVEFGRLNSGRSPSKVSDKAYQEAIDTINAAIAIGVDEAGRIVVTTADGEIKTIDSPLENLALYAALMENGYLPGIDLQDGVSLGALSFLADPAFTREDMLMAATLLAAGADKAGTISLDMVIYLASIMGVDGVNPVTGPDGKTYVDYSSLTYDRASTYTGTVTYLKDNGDGTYSLVTASIMDAVFGGEDYSGTQADAFAQAADDARAVIEFIHDNAPPGE